MENLSRECTPVQKSFRSNRCFLFALASLSLAGCNSSGRDMPDERPTIVSSDAVSISPTPNADADSSTANGSNSAADPVSTGSDPVAASDPAELATESASADEGAGAGEIDTIEALLAHLEATRNDTDANTVEPPAAGVVGANPDSEPPSTAIETSVLSDETGRAETAPATVGGTPASAVVPEDVTENPPVTGEPAIPIDNNPIDNNLVDDPAVDGAVSAIDIQGSADTEAGSVESVVESTAEEEPAEGTADSEAEPNTLGEQAETVADGAPVVADDVAIESDSMQSDASEAESSTDDPETPAQEDSSTVGGFVSTKNDIIVNCDLQLPCKASQSDDGVVVVVENVYRHPESRRLAIAMSVTANRDTALRWDDNVTSTDDVATTYNGTHREFSGFYQFDANSDRVTLLAGTTLLVVQHFRETPSDTTVAMVRFDTGFVEAGARTTLQFNNMPLDPVLGDIIDCADQVPCSWVANDQSYSVNVVKASGLWQTGRLRIDFEVRAGVSLGINMFSSESVAGNDGSVFTPRTHSLNGTSDYQEFTERLVPEGVLNGHQDFLKNANRQATSLLQVKLGMTRVDAPGAGSPVFRNLPLE